MIKLDTKGIGKTEVSLPGGQVLANQLASYKNRSRVTDVVPAYQAVITNQAVELNPRWAVKLQDGTYDFLP
jgi:regulatory protein YycH of two-component signal transduction system YycFG